MLKLLVIVVAVLLATIFVKPGWAIGTFLGCAEYLLFELPWWKTALIGVAVLGIVLICLKLEEKKEE